MYNPCRAAFLVRIMCWAMNISFWLHLEFSSIVIHDRTHTPQSIRIKSTSFSSISAVFGITHLLTCHLSTHSSHNYAINLQFLWNFHLKFSESHSRMSFCSKSTITNEKVFPIFPPPWEGFSTHAQLLEVLLVRVRMSFEGDWFWISVD